MMGGSDDPSDGPYPDVRGAFMLTLFAMIAAAFTGIAFIDFGLLAAIGIGQAIGVGAVATMGAKRVAEPQAERLGLLALDFKHVPAILCLAPAILLVSELDNFAADWAGSEVQAAVELDAEARSEEETATPDREVNYDIEERAAQHLYEGDAGSDEVRVGDLETSSHRQSGDDDNAAEGTVSGLVNTSDPWSVLSAFVVMVGISPVVEEFLFRGVIQQGLLQRMGLIRGVTMVALLWTLLRPAPLAGFARFAAAGVASFGLGWALGIVRIATRSILGSILLASSWAAIGLTAVVYEGKLDLPGMNVAGTHLPWTVTVASIILVAWAGHTIFKQAEIVFHEKPMPPSTPDFSDNAS